MCELVDYVSECLVCRELAVEKSSQCDCVLLLLLLFFVGRLSVSSDELRWAMMNNK